VYVDANQLSGLQDLVDATNNIDELSQRILVTPADDVQAEEFQKYALVIRQQLRKDPSDATGWQWLGRLRMSLGQTEEAVAAFDKALKISPDAQDIRMKYAQAMMMVGDDENLQNAKRQVSYLVQIAPENRNYRLLLTVVAAQLNDSEVAFANFALIKDALSADSTVYQSLVNQLRSMGASEGLLSLDNGSRNGLLDNSSLDNSPLDNSPLDNSSLDNSPLDNSPLDNSVTANGNRGFDVTVSIANELESKLPLTGFLILFAQDAISGSRVPLAVKKLALPQFPISLTLSANDAMIASLSLKNAEQVTITARISVDEDVMTRPGELEGSLASVKVNDSMQAVTLIINKEI
jgi:tetratricopeptide (TPR) repeat protein